MYTTFIILILVVAVLLILVVLIQNSKGGGLASNFSAPSQVMGVKKTNDFIEKATWVLAGVMIVLCLGISFISNQDSNRKPVNSRTIDIGTAPRNETPDVGGADMENSGSNIPQEEQ